MNAICICFQIHHPCHTRWYLPRDGYTRELDLDLYFDMQKNFRSFLDMCRESYLPTIETLKKTIRKYDSKYTLDISGISLDLSRWNPELTASLQALASTENVEFTCGPYYNSISPLFSNKRSFKQQVIMHNKKIKELFGVKPGIFINSDLIFTPGIYSIVEKMKFNGMITEGANIILNGRGPTSVFNNNKLPVMTRHIDLSEDIEKRFSTKTWVGYPLIPEKFASWISNMDGDVIALYIDCAFFGGHYNAGTHIFNFFEQLPAELEKKNIDMITPSEAIGRFKAVKLPNLQNESVVRYGMSGLLGNHMQHIYFNKLTDIGKRLDNNRNRLFKIIFGYLQQVDILSSMNSHNVPASFETALNNFSILSDFERRIIEEGHDT